MNIDPNKASNADIYKLLLNINKQNTEINKKLEEIQEKFKHEIKQIDVKVELLEEENRKLKNQLSNTQKQLKKYNIFVYGVDEKETDLKNVVEIIKNKLNINFEAYDIRDILRIGKKLENKTRPILVELSSYNKKLEILKNSGNLKGTGLYVCPDLTQQELEERKILIENLKAARAKEYSAKIVKNKLVVNGESFNVDQLKKNYSDIFLIAANGSDTAELKVRESISAPSTPDQNITFFGKNDDGKKIEKPVNNSNSRTTRNSARTNN